MLQVYMVTFTINIPQMLAIHGSYGIYKCCFLEFEQERREIISRADEKHVIIYIYINIKRDYISI